MTDLDKLDAPSDTVTWVLTSEEAQRYTVAVNEYDRLVAAARERDDEQDAVMRVYEAMDKYREEQAAKGRPMRPGWFLKLVAVISYERLAALHREDGA